jgi:N-acetylmuramoyl-L-alanine amidase
MNRFLIAMLIAVLSSIAAQAGAAPSTISPVVCIDPGHPSEVSSGAVVGRLSENHLDWVIASRVRTILVAKGVTVVLTKQREMQLVTNRRRAEIANAAHALLFIRLHCDVGSGRGFTWYYPAHPGTKDGVTGPSPIVCEQSRNLAESMNESMAPLLRGKLSDNPVKTDASTHVGSMQGGVLTGSIFARVPTALIEMCYLNQKRDARFIASDEGQRDMSEALAAGIMTYLANRPPN